MTGLPYLQWSATLKKIATDMPREALAAKQIRMASQMLRGVVERSPVGNPALWKGSPPAGYVGGTFKNSWVLEVGRITPGTVRRPDASGADSLSEVSRLSILARNPYSVVNIHNSLPYANRLEHGWSTQAPLGMVAVTAQSIATSE